MSPILPCSSPTDICWIRTWWTCWNGVMWIPVRSLWTGSEPPTMQQGVLRGAEPHLTASRTISGTAHFPSISSFAIMFMKETNRKPNRSGNTYELWRGNQEITSTCHLPSYSRIPYPGKDPIVWIFSVRKMPQMSNSPWNSSPFDFPAEYTAEPKGCFTWGSMRRGIFINAGNVSTKNNWPSETSKPGSRKIPSEPQRIRTSLSDI